MKKTREELLMSRAALRYGAKIAGVGVLAIGATVSSWSSRVEAQAWPQRPITLIVSQAAGASPDVMARMISDRLSIQLKQGVIIENKPGGGNVVGTVAAARSTPDGYTFFFATSA